MKARTGLGLSAAVLAWLCLSPGAFAVGTPAPNATVTYSAESVALTTGGNQVAIAGFNFFYLVAGAAVPPGPVTFIAPAGNNFTFAVGTVACTVGGVPYAFTAGSGTSVITCPAPGAPFTTIGLINFPALTTAVITLTGPNVVPLGNPIQPGGGPITSPNPTAVVQINASGPGDPASGIPNFSIISRNSFNIALTPQLLGIDLTGAGLPTIPPGAGFRVNPPTSGAATVSTAGFLGTFWINENQFDLDARNGLFSISATGAGTNGPLTGNTTVTLTGDFATITSAYLVPNNAGPPSANMSSACTATPPSNAIGGPTTLNAARSVITFPVLPTPANTAGNPNSPVFAVCLVTNGTQVIQATVNPLTIATPAIQINASIAVTGITNAIGLTGPNTGFGSINYEGTVFFAQNVFGINNGSPTFFRMVNQSNTAAQVWAVLTKDVPNTSPEVGAGSCTFQAQPPTPPSATLAPAPVPPNAVNPPTTCNISFVARLASQPGLPDTVSTNLTGGGPNGGMVGANNATYITGDDIAILAGTSLNPIAGQGSLHATTYLLSPNPGMRFSALTQSAAFGVLVQSP
jgi:hypothetical protein